MSAGPASRPLGLVDPGGIRRAVVSPAVEGGESKDQDAALSDAASLTACVCDGVSSSPHAATAAREMAARVVRILEAPHDRERVQVRLDEARAHLEALREQAAVAPLSYGTASQGARLLLEEVMRGKLMSSHQTTFLALRVLEPAPPGRARAWVVTCGDSALLLFDGAGRLEHSIPSGLVLPSPPRATRVLPDDEPRHGRVEIPFPGDVVLATDGFYNAFSEPEEILAWLRAHEATLYGDDAGAREGLLQGLHERLRQTVGDDDISVVWWTLALAPERGG